MKAYIILVGTELLNGAMVDTNSVYIANELNKVGIELAGKLTVADKIEDIESAIVYAKEKADIVILSGGLGPTIDDLTKDVIVKYLDKELVVDRWHQEEMQKKFVERGIDILPKNIKEVMIPKGSVAFQNEPGIAPGFYIDKIAAFPGVPLELKNLFPKFIDYILKLYKLDNSIYIRDLLVWNMPESLLEEKIIDIFEKTSFTLEFLVKNYGIIIRLLGREEDKNSIDKCIVEIQKRLGYNLISTNGNKIEFELVKLLRSLNYNLKIAESCTGGLITSTLISVPRVSDILLEGLVTYSNKSKIERLGVRRETLEKYGAVSKETVTEMLMGLDSHTAIAVSGIAGPGGGSKEKPVGTVYIGVRVGKEIKIELHKIKGDRERVRIKSSYTALFNLLNMLRIERGVALC